MQHNGDHDGSHNFFTNHGDSVVYANTHSTLGTTWLQVYSGACNADDNIRAPWFEFM
jgi:hypothetical protein